MNDEERLFATEEECVELRNFYLKNNIIIEADKDDVVKVKGNIAINTKKSSYNKRKKLINEGIISDKLYEVEKVLNYISSDKGEYNVIPVINDNDYDRKRSIYFRILQEILKSRMELKLSLGHKKPKDPDWYF